MGVCNAICWHKMSNQEVIEDLKSSRHNSLKKEDRYQLAELKPDQTRILVMNNSIAWEVGFSQLIPSTSDCVGEGYQTKSVLAKQFSALKEEDLYSK